MKNNRKKYNKEILEVIFKMIDLYPDLRFRQILGILQLDSDGFYEEPEETYKHIKEIIEKF